VRSWNLREIEAPDGTRDPVVIETRDDARAVLIVLSPGQELGDHQVKERAWLVVVDGSVEIAAGEERIDCSVGSLAMFDPNERHAIRSSGGARILLLLAPWPAEGHFDPHSR
jgi:quercetin dioxygenase-like cupin family protein